jgi:hypothetical protein
VSLAKFLYFGSELTPTPNWRTSTPLVTTAIGQRLEPSAGELNALVKDWFSLHSDSSLPYLIRGFSHRHLAYLLRN